MGERNPDFPPRVEPNPIPSRHRLTGILATGQYGDSKQAIEIRIKFECFFFLFCFFFFASIELILYIYIFYFILNGLDNWCKVGFSNLRFTVI